MPRPPTPPLFPYTTLFRSQFERTLIIVDEDAYVHYVEGCTAPIYSSDSLHSAVVEIVVKPRGRCRYTTIQRSEEHTSELQSQSNLVCRLLLEKKKNT